MKRILTTLCCVALASFSHSQGGCWTIDPVHTTIGFNATHLVISEVSGKLLEFSGNVKSLNHENFKNADVSLTIFTASVDKDNAERGKHLKSQDLLMSISFLT
jgi:polyisoprenoid-binding protein YceI